MSNVKVLSDEEVKSYKVKLLRCSFKYNNIEVPLCYAERDYSEVLIERGTSLNNVTDSATNTIKELRMLYSDNNICTHNLLFFNQGNCLARSTSANFICGYPCNATKVFNSLDVCDSMVDNLISDEQIMDELLKNPASWLLYLADNISAEYRDNVISLLQYKNRIEESKIILSPIVESINKLVNTLNKNNSSDEVKRPYKNCFKTYTRESLDLLFPFSADRPVLYKRLLKSHKRFIYWKPIYDIGVAGVGKNVLQEQTIRELCYDCGTIHLAVINFDSSTTQGDTTSARSPLTDRTIRGIYEEAIILANNLYFDGLSEEEKVEKLRRDKEIIKNGDYDCNEELVIVQGNEFSRQIGNNLEKIMSFLSELGDQYEIDGKIYYNTPNLLTFFNGNTFVNGKLVGAELRSDKAWTERFEVYELNGIFYTDPCTNIIQTDVYEEILSSDDFSESVKEHLIEVYNKLETNGLLNNPINVKDFRDEYRVSLRDILNKDTRNKLFSLE